MKTKIIVFIICAIIALVLFYKIKYWLLGRAIKKGEERKKRGKK